MQRRKKGNDMGFFDKLFGGKDAAETKFKGEKKTVMMPLAGKVIPLEELPDETFASAILGGGCGIEPTGDTVYAPFDGTVTQVPESLHAVGLMSDDGIELLIHVGMDTVEMKGNGFTSLTKEGSKVKATIFFRGRSILFSDQGEKLLLRFAVELEDYGKAEQMPKLEGKRMIMMIAPNKKK